MIVVTVAVATDNVIPVVCNVVKLITVTIAIAVALVVTVYIVVVVINNILVVSVAVAIDRVFFFMMATMMTI